VPGIEANAGRVVLASSKIRRGFSIVPPVLPPQLKACNSNQAEVGEPPFVLYKKPGFMAYYGRLTDQVAQGDQEGREVGGGRGAHRFMPEPSRKGAGRERGKSSVADQVEMGVNFIRYFIRLG